MSHSQSPAMIFFAALMTSAALASGLFSNSTFSQTRTFDGGGDGTTYHDPLNWSDDDIPDTAAENANIPAGFTVNIDSQLIEVASITVAGSTLNINAETNATGGINANDAATVVAINADTSASSTNLYGATLNLNAGVLSGDLYFYNVGPSQVNRNGGMLDLDWLWISSASSMTIEPTDNVSSFVDLFSGSELTVDAPLNLSGYLSVLGGTLNLNEDLVTTTVTLDDATLNRGPSVSFETLNLNLRNNMSYTFDGADLISGTVTVASSSSFVTNAPLNLTNSITATTACSLTFNAMTSASAISVNDPASSLTVNADTSAGSTSIFGSTLNLNSGALSGDLYFYNSSGIPQVNRNGGSLDLRWLWIRTPMALDLPSTDTVSDFIDVYDGATLTVDRELVLAGYFRVDQSTVNLNDDLITPVLYVRGASATINRASSTSIEMGTLDLNDNVTYTYDGTDTISSTINAFSNAHVMIDVALDVSGNLNAGTNSSITINAPTTAGSLNVSGSSTLDMMAPTAVNGISVTGEDSVMNVDSDVSAASTSLFGCTCNLNSGGTLTGDLYLYVSGGPAQINQNGGAVDIPWLWMNSGSAMTIGPADDVTARIDLFQGATLDITRSIELSSYLQLTDGTLTYAQDPGGTDGISVNGALTINAGSQLILDFDEVEVEGLDWALRWSGDRASELQTMINDGSIVANGGSQIITIIYDPANYGDYTYVGYIGAAVPPLSYDVTRGQQFGGDLMDLTVSDNSDLSVRRNNADIQSRVFVEFESVSPEAIPTEFGFTVEAAVFARSRVIQRIDLFNFVSGSFEEVDSRNASRFSDMRTVVSATGDLSRFVESGTNTVRARVRFQSLSPRQQFAANIDQVYWTIR